MFESIRRNQSIHIIINIVVPCGPKKWEKTQKVNLNNLKCQRKGQVANAFMKHTNHLLYESIKNLLKKKSKISIYIYIYEIEFFKILSWPQPQLM